MKKMILVLAGAVFSLGVAQSGMAASASNETPVAVSPISFSDVSGTVREASLDGRAVRVLEVYGVAAFSSACEVPSLLVKEDQMDTRSGARDYRVLAARPNRMCAEVYMPVTKKFLIDRVTLDEGSAPAVAVNGRTIHWANE